MCSAGGLDIARELRIQKAANKYGTVSKGPSELEKQFNLVKTAKPTKVVRLKLRRARSARAVIFLFQLTTMNYFAAGVRAGATASQAARKGGRGAAQGFTARKRAATRHDQASHKVGFSSHGRGQLRGTDCIIYLSYRE